MRHGDRLKQDRGRIKVTEIGTYRRLEKKCIHKLNSTTYLNSLLCVGIDGNVVLIEWVKTTGLRIKTKSKKSVE
jgi:hypothetical protein